MSWTNTRNTIMTVNESQIRAAIRQNEEKLARQEQAAEATRGMLDLLRSQLQGDTKAPKR